MSTVRAIVESNGGTIAVDSRIGLGATFTIEWPRSDAAAATSEEAVPAVVPASLMVVEDDAALLRHVDRILRNAGYIVRSAGSAEDAWPIIQAHEEIDLLLTDVVLPGISGVQFADRVIAARPALKVLFMSGYADEGLSAVEQKAVEGQLLRKPFTAAQVVTLVRTALGGPGPSAPEPKPRG